MHLCGFRILMNVVHETIQEQRAALNIKQTATCVFPLGGVPSFRLSSWSFIVLCQCSSIALPSQHVDGNIIIFCGVYVLL